MERKTIVVYVAGPFRAPNAWGIEQNVREAETLALILWREGFAPICPHTMTRHYQGALPDETFLRGDLAILERCDAVILTKEWDTSEGTSAELAHAEDLGIPAFLSVPDLLSWREGLGE